jgi:hypothetical protein
MADMPQLLPTDWSPSASFRKGSSEARPSHDLPGGIVKMLGVGGEEAGGAATEGGGVAEAALAAV